MSDERHITRWHWRVWSRIDKPLYFLITISPCAECILKKTTFSFLALITSFLCTLGMTIPVFIRKVVGQDVCIHASELNSGCNRLERVVTPPNDDCVPSLSSFPDLIRLRPRNCRGKVVFGVMVLGLSRAGRFLHRDQER